MCIIALSPACNDLPTVEQMRYMFSKNPDGAGFAIQGDLKGDGVFRVEYKKGFMNIDDFLEALGPRERLKDFTVALHFRIKTHGEVDKGTTHPFPLSDQYVDLRATEGKGAVLFHNGTFAGLGGKADAHSSDTQDFVIGVANRFLKNAKMPGAVSDAVVSQLVGMNRVLILYPKASFPMLRWGTWYEYEGNWYSNMGYKPYEAPASSITPQSRWWDDDDYHYTPTKNSLEELDEWGCNVAEYAWPDKNGWMRCKTKERFNRILETGKDRGDRGGMDSCKFYRTGETIWYIDEERLELYTMDRLDDVELRDSEEAAMCTFTYMIPHEYICFEDEDQMIDWFEKCTPVSSYEMKFSGDIWYLDTINLEAYTDKGLKKMFKPGEVGHVRKSLQTEGSTYIHYKSADIREPDDDDLEAFLPRPVDKEDIDWDGIENYGRS